MARENKLTFQAYLLSQMCLGIMEPGSTPSSGKKFLRKILRIHLFYFNKIYFFRFVLTSYDRKTQKIFGKTFLGTFR